MFEWSLPTKLVFGVGRFRSAHKYVRGFGKRAFVVTSPSFGAGGARAAVLDALLSQLKSSGLDVAVFSGIEPNPRTETIDRAAVAARAFNPRFVLALGGGSVMDAAKCVALLGVQDNQGSIYEYAHRGVGQERRQFNHALPLVCVPTIAATGSEANQFAVVTNWREHRKVTIFGKALQPALAIIDPELTYSLDPGQTVNGAFDIICHVMEDYLSAQAPAPVQDRLTEGIVETVVSSLRRVLDDPRDELGRSQLSWCSTLALSGVLSGRDGPWPIHALEHGLSAWSDVAHGQGLAFLLPRVMAFDAPVIAAKLVDFNRRIFGVAEADPARALEKGLISFMKEVGAWTTLATLSGGLAPAELAQKAVDHALEVSGVWKRGQEPYLANCRPLGREEALSVLLG